MPLGLSSVPFTFGQTLRSCLGAVVFHVGNGSHIGSHVVGNPKKVVETHPRPHQRGNPGDERQTREIFWGWGMACRGREGGSRIRERCVERREMCCSP
jgi:hypothetical protein